MIEKKQNFVGFADHLKFEFETNFGRTLKTKPGAFLIFV